jgi:Domain of unknown function (DUF6438)
LQLENPAGYFNGVNMSKLLKATVTIGWSILLIGFFISIVSAQKKPQLDSLTSEQLTDLIIQFERTGCYGNCPAYKLTIYGDGRVEYDGIRDVKTKGKKTGKISESDIRVILSAFAKADFFAIGENVSAEKCSCRQCTDFPTALTEISLKDTSHKVNHYLGCGCATKELYSLEEQVDQLTKVEIWTGDVSKAGPFGTTCWGPPPCKPK